MVFKLTLSVERYTQLLEFQVLIVLSSDADTNRVESWEKVTELIASLCPSSVDRQALH